jgi:hypothetical protein
LHIPFHGRVILAGLLILMLEYGPARASSPAGPSVGMGDRIALPPLEQRFVSPLGTFVFDLTAIDGWATPSRSMGTLWIREGVGLRELWRRQLPHGFRPRFVIVDDAGHVLLVDEWIKVRTRFALMLLDRDNHELARRSLDDILPLLDIPVADLVRAARFGWWLSAAPLLDDPKDAVLIQTPGNDLRVDLRNGGLFPLKR